VRNMFICMFDIIDHLRKRRYKRRFRRYDVLTAVKISISISRVITLCGLVGRQVSVLRNIMTPFSTRHNSEDQH
jgi:hypothetical protein